MSEKKTNKCWECDDKLRWGDFAYNQELCWNCFSRRVAKIFRELNKATLDEYDRGIAKHMYNVMAEAHNKPRLT